MCISVIPALGRKKQEVDKFKVIFGDIPQDQGGLHEILCLDKVVTQRTTGEIMCASLGFYIATEEQFDGFQRPWVQCSAYTGSKW